MSREIRRGRIFAGGSFLAPDTSGTFLPNHSSSQQIARRVCLVETFKTLGGTNENASRRGDSWKLKDIRKGEERPLSWPRAIERDESCTIIARSPANFLAARPMNTHTYTCIQRKLIRGRRFI